METDYETIVTGGMGEKSELIDKLITARFVSLSIALGISDTELNDKIISLTKSLTCEDPQSFKVPNWKKQQTFGHGGKGDRIRKRQQWRRK